MARPKGAKNKVSGTAKENIIAVFTRLGGTAKMAEWAEDNQTEFYKIYSRLLPTEIEGDINAQITYVFRNPTARPVEMTDGHHRSKHNGNGAEHD